MELLDSWTIGLLDSLTVEQFVLICKFCKIITNVLYLNDIFSVSYLFSHFMELLDNWMVGLLDNFYLSVNSVKSVKPSQTFYI